MDYKESWGFRHEISEAKNLKMSVTNIGKHSGEFRRRARWLQNFTTWRTPFRSQWNCPSAWCDRLPMALTPSFQLRIVHRLKRWIADFPSSKRHIVCINWAPGSAPKVADSCCPFECFMIDFSLCFPSLHFGFAYGKGL